MNALAGHRPVESLSTWAHQVAEHVLAAPLPQRWAHVQGVARQARTLRAVVDDDADLLEAAAILHDVGYAPALSRTGFHPLDGAAYLASLDAPDRLVHLVAHHSYAALEADMRGLADELAAFLDEGGAVRDALWYCDLTTTPDGRPIAATDRITEIQSRYGPQHLVTAFITAAAPELLAAVARTERRSSHPVG